MIFLQSCFLRTSTSTSVPLMLFRNIPTGATDSPTAFKPAKGWQSTSACQNTVQSITIRMSVLKMECVPVIFPYAGLIPESC